MQHDRCLFPDIQFYTYAMNYSLITTHADAYPYKFFSGLRLDLRFI